MPPILTPPEIDRRYPKDIRENDNGSGRRPPTDKRTGGNGEGDGHSSNRQPTSRLSQVRIGVFFGLFGVAMFFVAIISAFFARQSAGHVDAYSRYINDWLPTAIPRILWLNSAVLIISSATAEIARRSMFVEHDVMDEWIGFGRPTSRRATLWLSITLALGTLFLAGQWIAWQQLGQQHVYLRSNASSHFFYIITVAHAVHLFLGVTALIAALIGLNRSRRLATRQILVDATVWYWHAMGALWLILFLLLEFCQ